MESTSSGPRRTLAWLLAHGDGGRRERERGRAWLDGDLQDEGAERALSGRAEAAEQTLARLGWRLVSSREEVFPDGVAALADPPLALFLRGRLPMCAGVAVVGSRQASGYGREVAEYFGRELARAGVPVLSGMARGVDAAAHRGALSVGGTTVAVWGAGPDRVYPPEHGTLAEEIAQDGALLTEYPPGSPPRPFHFPERNRILVGLCRAVVVIEAAERSGALITARLALEEGREVLAVPGSIFSRLSAGPNGLLRAGAAPALTVGDILAAVGLQASPEPHDGAPLGLLAVLPPGETMSVDELAARAGQPVAAVLEALFHAELAGTLVREADGRYRRNRAVPTT
jgi:DNA processing protein